MDPYTQAVAKIIQEQQTIIGPVALDQAKKVAGIEVASGKVKLVGEGKDLLSKLVNQYAKLFGRASIEVCREAVKETKSPLTHEQLPEILQ